MNTTMTPMMIASIPCPSAADRATAISRMRMRTFRNWAASSAHGEVRSGASSSFGPILARRRIASAVVSPRGEVSSARTDSSTVSVWNGIEWLGVSSCVRFVASIPDWFIATRVVA